MNQEFIKSLIGKKVRFKSEYIQYFVNEENGEPEATLCTETELDNFFDNVSGLVMVVKMDCFGVDLWNFRRNEAKIEDLPAPTHMLIIDVDGKGSGYLSYPFLWDAKYFEVVEQ